MKIPDHGGNIEEAAAVFKADQSKIADFSASINPLPFPGCFKPSLDAVLSRIRNYPPPYPDKLIASIADYLKIPSSCLLAGNGSIELIYFICSAFQPRRALIFIPTFSEYERALNGVKAAIDFRNLADFSRMKRRYDMVFLCNPNNPTADLFTRKTLEPFIKSSPGTLFLIDEVFMDFVQEKQRYSMISCLGRYKNIMLLGSLTKFFALAGLRLGYLAADRKITATLRKMRYPWAVNYPAMFAAQLLLKNKTFIRESREFISAERAFLFRGLSSIRGISPSIPAANFIFCTINGTTANSTELYRRLAKKGLLIRDCSNFRGLNKKHFRVAVKRRDENSRLIKELKSIFKNA